jgi:MHS family metabolite:H+ symporter-like MFS transporter
MLKSKSFWLATGLRFGQAGNSGLLQTFLAGYLVQTLLFDKAIPTDALMISSGIGFITIPLLGWLSDKMGRRVPYIIVNITAILLAYPMVSIIVDKSYSVGAIMASLIVIHNIACWVCSRLKISPWRKFSVRVTALREWRFQKKPVD